MHSSELRALVVDVVERASGWRERLSPDFVAGPRVGGERPGQLLDIWRANSARGDDDAFDQRLALDGLDRQTAARALAPARRAPGATLPEWARLLELCLQSLADTALRSSDADESVPFVELLAPFADISTRELEERSGTALARVSDAARLALRGSLLRRLAGIAAPQLYERFDRVRARDAARTEASAHASSTRGAGSRELYAGFVREMLAGGMHLLVAEFPALARALGTIAIHWRDASTELLVRLHADRATLADHFNGGSDPGDLVGIRAGCSDPHSGGRSVHILRFANGLRLVYKPRSLGVDAAFMGLLDWMALRGAPVPTRQQKTFAARALDRVTHGWAEFVRRSDCSDSHAARRYYQNAGSLLALLHALGSSDCHYENIVAAGDRPVLVDLETIMQPEIARAEPPLDRARNRGARLIFDDSILRTGMLPTWQPCDAGGAFDLGGLTAGPGQKTSFTTTRWSAINSDAMRLHHEPATTDASSNLPRLGGRSMTPAGCAGELQCGFTRMYEWLAAHRDEVAAPGGPLARLAREDVRFIVRPSSVYDYVLRRSLRSRALRDGAARGVELELLARALVQLPPELRPILAEEERALEELDIPVFSVAGDSTMLRAGAHMLRLTRSALDVARARLRSLGPADLALQLRILQSSLALRYFAGATESSNQPKASAEAPPASSPDGRGAISASSSARAPVGPAESEPDATPLQRSALIACAARIAGEIRETALTDCAGYRTWIVTEPVSRAGHQRLRATGYGLYDGVAGIALFLAAASRCTGDADAALLAADALAPLRARLHAAPSYADEHGLGGAGGAASAIYALTRAGVLLGDDSLLDDAMRAALQITPAVIARDTTFDVMYGSAGAILALLALFEARPRDWLVERAIDCGRRLLDSRRPLAVARDTTPRAWPSSRERRPVGLAHGASGIALALFRLHAATGVAEYGSAAIDAVEADEMLRNGSGTSWCRGSAGIGLVCLAPAAGSQALALRARARGCVSHVRMCSVLSGRGGDGLCCGTMGEVELLLTAGLRWGDATLLAAAHQRASHVIRRLRATRRGASTGAERLDVADPALYRGTAGIGYSLLRLCHPEILPSLLSWE